VWLVASDKSLEIILSEAEKEDSIDGGEVLLLITFVSKAVPAGYRIPRTNWRVTFAVPFLTSLRTAQRKINPFTAFPPFLAFRRLTD